MTGWNKKKNQKKKHQSGSIRNGFRNKVVPLFHRPFVPSVLSVYAKQTFLYGEATQLEKMETNSFIR